ncbi:beta-ketoacyl-ACP synthase II [Anaerotalea alkaliphila]|uniref:3-oxoacyl-[acyl-carrier-protein] synthase 2 n=1 Tax=Anaerotalea alkaliphila TaxID=2662126 RepID=A0A7X5HWR9_9FIRM|nr:beta-ketoacyl-ACP synthase II [Anaerotalea alkaliphila]NDL68067.1 beta-ketoacyl-ACP synthase II [Anaerotalea alkaliphila]
MERRVVVTGLGVVSPVGNSVEEFWKNIRAGVKGFGMITKFDTAAFGVKVAAELKDFKAQDYMDRKTAKKMDEFTQYAVAAAKQAVEDAKIDFEAVDPYRMGVVLGSGIGGLGTIEEEEQKLLSKGPSRVSPTLIPRIITNMAAGNVAIEFNCKGVCTNVVTACASGTHSIGEAFRAIKHGYGDIMLAGGTEASIVPLGLAGFTNLTALSTNPDPDKASRPFDKDRDGFVMGEGAGVLVLESLEHAQKRGAAILAEIVGYGATCDAFHQTSPDPSGDGAARAMKLAMEEAGVRNDQISYINAHGTSTPYNDKFETQAIKSVFGEQAKSIPVSSTKSMIGHLLGAAGAVEAAACVKTIQDQFIHPTMNYDTPDEDCDLDYVPNVGRSVPVEYVLSNSLGFGGHNATLLFKKFE